MCYNCACAHQIAGGVDIYPHNLNLQVQSIAMGRGKEGKSLKTSFFISYNMSA